MFPYFANESYTHGNPPALVLSHTNEFPTGKAPQSSRTIFNSDKNSISNKTLCFIFDVLFSSSNSSISNPLKYMSLSSFISGYANLMR